MLRYICDDDDDDDEITNSYSLKIGFARLHFSSQLFSSPRLFHNEAQS